MELSCPLCSVPLSELAHDRTLTWSCARCGGRAISLAALRKDRDANAVATLWNLTRAAETKSGKRCAGCARPAVEIALPLGAAGSDSVTLDVCRPCQLVWFDPGEAERIPKRPPPPVPIEKDLPAEAKVAMAKAMAEGWRDRQRDERRLETGIDIVTGVLDILGELGP